MMNRKHKYRFYDPDNHSMHDVLSLDFEGCQRVVVSRKPTIRRSVYLGYLLQFTGLLDKNGKEIYVGDVLSDGHKYLTVSYKTVNGAFWATNETYRIYAHKFKIFAVIGNIHESPELLEQ